MSGPRGDTALCEKSNYNASEQARLRHIEKYLVTKMSELLLRNRFILKSELQ